MLLKPRKQISLDFMQLNNEANPHHQFPLILPLCVCMYVYVCACLCVYACCIVCDITWSVFHWSVLKTVYPEYQILMNIGLSLHYFFFLVWQTEKLTIFQIKFV